MKPLQKVGLTQNEQLEKALSGSLQTSEAAKNLLISTMASRNF